MRDGTAVDLGGARTQTLLALLALRAGSAVSPDLLTDELWAGEPPEGAFTTLRSYVSRLRAALGNDVSIERSTAGYVLGVPPETIDAVRFERATRDADALIAEGRHRRAAEALHAALSLWHGEPFAGLANDGILRAESMRLEELRLHATEARIGADLESGRSGELVDELEALLATHPFRERLWHALMLALYRSGRQADALAAYHRARAAMDEQLGIEPGPELRDLEAAILRQDVPGPGSGVAPSGSLPAALTRFIGRQAELGTVGALLRRARLVTLVGVGGIGKTRLAIEAARGALDELVDRVAVVDLAALSDPGLIEDHVAAALGADGTGAAPPMAAITEAIGSDEALLVLDNCEHLRDAAAAFAQALLTACPNTRIVATSRLALDVAGEATYPVPPLALDRPEDGGRVSSEAVQLLLDRVTLSRHDLVIDAAAYQTAARICRDLDGLPLAIELAAARSRALSLDEIASRLQDRFQFLVPVRRLASARLQTLEEAMDWSYGLLEPDEQRLLAQLSVFPAGAMSDAIAAVCVDGDRDAADRLLERLVDASLVVPMDTERGTRYRLLETVRAYADQRLADEERHALQRRHAQHVWSLARSTNLSLEGTAKGAPGDLAAAFELARTELPSIRAAIDWAARHDHALGIRIAGSLERFWVSNHPTEGAAVFTRLLEADGIDDRLRALALRCRGGTRYVSGAFGDAIADYEAAISIHRKLHDDAYVAHLLMRLAIDAQRVGDARRAQALLAEAERVGADERFVPDAYVSLSLLADLAFDEGRVDEALDLQRKAGELAEAAGDGWWRADTLMQLADRAIRSGRPAVGGPAAREALAWARRITDRQSIVFALALLACEAAASGDLERAGRIWGGVEAEVERGGHVGQWELEAPSYQALLGPDSDAFRSGLAAGRRRSLEDTIEDALSPA